MNEQLLAEVTVFVLAVFVGFEVISKVPTTLHTPLMSATNAIHGIVLVGALLVAGVADPKLGAVLSVIVVILASLNVFGGYVVTERMLQMFKPRAAPAPRAGDGKAAPGSATAAGERAGVSAR
jgi:NAD(P) transhydrogenase subunit alpha